MKNPHVTILQTSFAKRDDTIVFLKEKVPGVKVEFITDSTILADVRANGGPTKEVYDRMKLYAKAAEISGADLIVNSCSTVGEVADEYRKEVSIPVMKIEDPMCQEAAKLGTKFAIFGTVETSMGPVARIIEYVSGFCTLKTGDLIFTGTPVGVGPVSIGQHLQGFLEGKNVLDFHIR